jgi:cell division protein FtsB
MNANELADMAENACCAYQKEIATMLRQQQAELDVLKERNRFLESFYRTVKAQEK